MIKVFRYGARPTKLYEGRRRILQKKKHSLAQPPTPLGVDHTSITTGASLDPIELFSLGEYSNPVTLTQREADLVALANPGARTPRALETLHPWLPRQKYVENANANYVKLLSVLRQYGDHLFAPAQYCNQLWNTVCNSLRMTSLLDCRYYSAWHLPLQDAYLLEETRADRTVIAIDFNAMYAACMQHPFPAPGGMKLERYDRILNAYETLPPGLYRCILSGTTSTFIRKYSPFRSFFSGRYLGSRLERPIDIDLNEFEVHFYRKHFSNIHITDAIHSDHVVAHPLARAARRADAQRANYKAQGNKPLADREKFKMTLMASCTNRPNRRSIELPSFSEGMAHLGQLHGIHPHLDEPEASVTAWLDGRKRITLRPSPGGATVSEPVINDASACYSLSQRIVARGRTIVLDHMERLCKLAPDVEIAYCNIDSIHLSVPNIHLQSVLETLEATASTAMGGFKIEAVTNCGLWLEPGRYWLYSKTVDKFSNAGVGDGLHPFNETKIYVTSRELDGLHIPVPIVIGMARLLSDAKGSVQDEHTGTMKQQHTTISTTTPFHHMLSEIEKNRQNAVPLKLAAFTRLKNRFERVK